MLEGINWYIVGAAVLIAAFVCVTAYEVVRLRRLRKERDYAIARDMSNFDEEYRRLLESA